MLAGFPRELLQASEAETVITILHTNDTHSQIDPLPANDANAGKGGVARRATPPLPAQVLSLSRIGSICECVSLV